MTCACSQDEKGNVTNLCGAHVEVLRRFYNKEIQCKCDDCIAGTWVVTRNYEQDKAILTNKCVLFCPWTGNRKPIRGDKR
jgi:hypothetical protein